MGLPNVTGAIIAQGHNCQVRIQKNGGALEKIALVASFQANEDYQTQEATCLGHLGPISLDPQGYTCSITLDGFLPARGKLEGEETGNIYEESGNKAIPDLKPWREDYAEQGLVQKIEYLDFYNRKQRKIMASFKGVIFTSYGVSAEGNAYVRNNVQMRALSWTKQA
jgi:hypothetical protein